MSEFFHSTGDGSSNGPQQPSVLVQQQQLQKEGCAVLPPPEMPVTSPVPVMQAAKFSREELRQALNFGPGAVEWLDV